MVERADVDLYGVLGVAHDATAAEIRHAYRRLARERHPDLNPHPDGSRRFAMLAEAYAILHDPAQRARYDRRLRPPAAAPPPPPRRQPPTAGRVHARVLRGVLELSPAEAALLARHQLTLHDALGQALVVPAGTRHGDHLALLRNGDPAVLAVVVRGET